MKDMKAGVKGTTTPCTFTEQQKAFIGPHHGPKMLGQKAQSNYKGDSNGPSKVLL